MSHTTGKQALNLAARKPAAAAAYWRPPHSVSENMMHSSRHHHDSARFLSIPPAHVPQRPTNRGSPILPVSCVTGNRHQHVKNYETPRTAASPSVSIETPQPLDLTVKKDNGFIVKTEPCEPEGASLSTDEPMDLSVSQRPLDLSTKSVNDVTTMNGRHQHKGAQESLLRPLNFSQINPEPEQTSGAETIIKHKKRKRKRKTSSTPDVQSAKEIKSPKLAILVDSNGDEIYRMSSQSLCNKTVSSGNDKTQCVSNGNTNIPATETLNSQTGSTTTPVKLKSLLTGAIVTQLKSKFEGVNPCKTPPPSNHGDGLTKDGYNSTGTDGNHSNGIKPERSHGNSPDDKSSDEKSSCTSPIETTSPLDMKMEHHVEETAMAEGLEIHGVIKPEELAAHLPTQDPVSPAISPAPIPTTVEEVCQDQKPVQPDKEVPPVSKKKKDRKKSKARKNKETKSSSKEAEKKAPFILRPPVYNGKTVDIKREIEEYSPQAENDNSVIKGMLESGNSLNHFKLTAKSGTNGIKDSIALGSDQSNQDIRLQQTEFTGSKLFSLLTGNMTNNTYSTQYNGNKTDEGGYSVDTEIKVETASAQSSNEDVISKVGGGSPVKSDQAVTVKTPISESAVKKEVNVSSADQEEHSIGASNSGIDSAGYGAALKHSSPTSYRSLLSGKVVKQCDVTDGVMVVARGHVRGEKNSRYELVVDFQPEVKRPTKTPAKHPIKSKTSSGKKKPRVNKLEQICQSLWLKSKENI